MQRIIVIAAVVALWHTSIGAQCTKDTDCKGDRICVGGQCVEASESSVPLQPDMTATPTATTQPSPISNLPKSGTVAVPARSTVKKTSLAVITLKNTSGLSEGDAEVLTDRLRVELFSTGVVDVMERDQMKEVLKEQGFQQSGACTDEACLVQIGRLLGVQRVAMGTIGKLGSMYLLNIRLVDVQTARMMQAVARDIDGSIEKVVAELREVARELVRDEVVAGTKSYTPETNQPEPADESGAEATSSSTSTSETYVQADAGKAVSDSRCSDGGFSVDGRCLMKEDVVGRGATGFAWSMVPYFIGGLYNGVASVVWSVAGWNDGGYYYSSSYNYDDGYYSEDGLLALVPQSSAILIPGVFNQIAKVKQRKYIRALGGKPSVGITISGLALFGVSILTPILYFVSYGNDNESEATSLALINAPVQVASIVVNMIGFYKNRGQLRTLTGSAETSSLQGIEVSPYLAYARKAYQAGVVVKF